MKTQFTHVPFFLKDKDITDNDQTLMLRNKNINTWPNEIHTQLLILDLSGNRFQTIPHQVNLIQHLQKLILRDNSIDNIETSLNLPQLLHLDLSYNYIRKVPSSLIRLNSLHHLNLNSNLIDELPRQLFDLQLFFLGIAKNAFTMIPQDICKVIKKLEQFELDWLNYCNFSYFMDEQTCKKLMVVFAQDCTFSQFYEYFMNSQFSYNLEKIINNHSLGILKLSFEFQIEVSMKSLIFVVSQPGTKENIKFIDYLIDLLNQNDSQLLNVIYILSARTNQTFIIQILSKYTINLHYPIKFDLICNHKILIIKGQTPYTTLLQHSHNIEAIMDFQVQKGFNPKIKHQGENCLHIAVRLNAYEGVKWALKNCNVDQSDSIHKNTPLHILFQRQQSVDIFYLLENYRPNPFIVNRYNKIPRYYQTQMIQLRFVKLYLKYEKCYLRFHFLTYNSNKFHGMITLGSRSNARQESEISAVNTTDTSILSGEQLLEYLLSEILKILRSSKQIPLVIDKINLLIDTSQDLHAKMCIQQILYLLNCKAKYGWNYKSTFLPQLITQINLLFKNRFYLEKRFFFSHDLKQMISENKKQIINQNNIAQNKIEQEHIVNLSQKLKFNISNILDNQTNTRFHEQYVINYMNIAYLCKNRKMLRKDNINILNQFEELQIRKDISAEELIDLPESPRNTLLEKMKHAPVVKAKFKDFPNIRSKSQIDM
ncbi:unnamed protein product (macronuclear) [Paramecium tetraurelia]|uniref:Uncharacterized protein n=1 Tax=Paramecium tetraurelia TaxID=5888 RepID=A0BQC4_PARTE|nr:uncharacterized protein GSPATT00030970001 [Paramecium tetraurelia]CAK60741.1 unnamed protein product [Paramecium tetraurelia]|eukprot:XP_001428139.1 hypothetical protein (macronuclear) [Paramecium tetraurelia strain d4-2]